GDPGLVYGDVGERAFTRDVADGPHTVGDTQVLVHWHGRGRPVDAQDVGTDRLEVRVAARRNQELLRGYRTAVAERHGESTLAVGDVLGARPHDDGDALGFEDSGEHGPGVGLLERHEAIGHLDDGDGA